ncbi:MAG: hypothetical protein D6775_16850 [Caldilineae bacterium]|nr:MAG: hypothetical protein D6775_16850 [Caldilineae bacterium]
MSSTSPVATTPYDKPKKRSTAQKFWQEHLRKQQQSGMSRAAYCRAHGLSYHAMSSWASRLGRTRPSRAGKAPTIIPLATISATAREEPDPVITICVADKLRVEIRNGCKANLLRQVLQRVVEAAA